MKPNFSEQYEVKFSYQKPDGYWECSKKELISIPIKTNMKEKCNHEKAVEVIKSKYKNCIIINCSYC